MRVGGQESGQTLVLSALLMLLVCVLALMTLNLGMRIREKTDLNALADAAAYNQAVATARTLNLISLANRTQISHMVALAGVQSLISWTGMYRGTLTALRQAVRQAGEPYEDSCDDGARCGCASQVEFQTIEAAIIAEQQRVASVWEVLDANAGAQARAIRAETLKIYAEEAAFYQAELLTALKDQNQTKALVDQARASTPWRDELNAPGGGASIALREVSVASDCREALGVACTGGQSVAHAVWAGMGTRGFQFTTGRDVIAPFMARVTAFLPPGVSVSMRLGGSAYFSQELAHGKASTSNQQAWADDHLQLSVKYARGQPGCQRESTGRAGADAWVKSSSLSAGGDEHAWSGGADTDPSSRHTVMGGIWPDFIDYNPAKLIDAADNYGQPKAYAVLQRDYGVRSGLRPPWERKFAVGFSATGSPGGVDLGKLELADGTPNRLQTSLSTGVAYYHRPGHWREPPNFLNPFWHATLMSADVDAQAEADVPATLREAGSPIAAAAFQKLRATGYRGF